MRAAGSMPRTGVAEMAHLGIQTKTPVRVGTVERAFQLAGPGQCREIGEIARRLKAERYERVEEHLAGRSIRNDLRRAWEAVRS